MTTFTPALAAEYDALWRSMVIDADRLGEVDAVARKIIARKETYARISARTGVPWWFIGLLHYRESGCDFATHLHNGDPLTRRTVHVPAGRPPTGAPPYSFEDSAADALAYEGFDHIGDWSVPHVCFLAEQYNGFGYRGCGVRSPYLWGATNQQQRGKYVRDGVFDAAVWDRQLGVAAILKLLLATETSAETPKPGAAPAPASPQFSFWARLRSLFRKG